MPTHQREWEINLGAKDVSPFTVRFVVKVFKGGRGLVKHIVRLHESLLTDLSFTFGYYIYRQNWQLFSTFCIEIFRTSCYQFILAAFVEILASQDSTSRSMFLLCIQLPPG